MERLLLLWDELDDVAAACRHVAASAADEVASVAVPVAALVSALGAGLVSLYSQAHVALVNGIVASWIE